MKSTVNLKGHPVHAILVSFPVAFFSGTLLFDILALAGNNNAFAMTAYYLNVVGVLSAVLAAVPGIIDFVFTVPPKSSGKKRGLQHGLINVCNLLLFSLAWFLKRSTDITPVWVIGIEGLGFILLCIAAWMGGTLVYRNQIGVDVRYANAGQWKEERINSDSNLVELHGTHELKQDQMRLLHINGKRIVIARTEKELVAFEDGCTHKGGSLAAGSMICGTVQCPWHGSQFDTTNGTVKAGPAKKGIAVFKITEKGGKAYLSLDMG